MTRIAEVGVLRKNNKHLMCFLGLSLVCGLLAAGSVSAQDATRGVERIEGAGAAGPLLADHYSASYALLIGVDEYQHGGWDRLPTVPQELAAVESMLLRQGFEVETLSNLSGRELMNRLTDFVADKGYDENNRLLVYFSGHGETVELSRGRQMGYFVPADAPPYGVDKRGFVTRAIDESRDGNGQRDPL
ncbi:MAG: caspase family protein [Granulosicoccaceae bacterium]